jgi:hypothetical protein
VYSFEKFGSLRDQVGIQVDRKKLRLIVEPAMLSAFAQEKSSFEQQTFSRNVEGSNHA